MESFLYTQINVIGFIILAILLSNQKKSVGITVQQELFNTLIAATMYVFVLDSALWLLDGKTFRFANEVLFLMATGYYFLCVFISFIWLIYSDCTLNNTTQHLRKRLVLYAIPLVMQVILLIYNAWSGIVFYIDADNTYHRGKWVLISVLLSFIYLLCSTSLALRKGYRSKVVSEKKQAFLMAAFVLPPFVGTIIQSMYYGLSLIWISTTISMLMIFVNIQNQQINTDSLTGLNNRLQFDKYLYFKTKDTSSKDVFSLIMIDVDKFKQINDTHGHLAGDKALVCVGEILKKSCKNKNVFISRYGGDEFAIIYQTRQLANVHKLIALIQQNIQAYNMSNTEVFTLSLSIGFAIWKRNYSIDTLISLADDSMYQIKRKKVK